MTPTLFEDEWILAVYKPSGLPSQSLGVQGQETAEDLIQRQNPHATLRLCHRLDTGTSGVLLFAKSDAVFEEIRMRFRERSIKKFYDAFCRENAGPFGSRPLVLPHTIDLPLAHHPKSKKRMIPLPEGKRRQYRGKPLPALSIIHEIHPDRFMGAHCLKVQVEIKTGVMHQIRVHLAHIGLPLLGDPLYGSTNGTSGSEPHPAPRLGLHARKIAFELGGFRYSIEAAL
ncbi:MAG: RluA family pseudouridine synthase [Proteobacteria bacterium]|nr:RluA family pseudouridine synthase [Pseudomonadota bacterium]